MNALQELIEIEPAMHGHGQLAVEHELPRFQATQGRHHFRKVAGKRLLSLGLQIDAFVVTKGQAAETVPFWLILPARASRDRLNRQCLHGSKRWFEFQHRITASGVHRSSTGWSLSPWRPSSSSISGFSGAKFFSATGAGTGLLGRCFCPAGWA